MSTPESPIRIDIPSGATAVVVSDDGIMIYRYEESSFGSDPTWEEIRHDDRDALASIGLNDATIDPPLYGEFQVSIEIDAPVEHVFEYVADIQTHPKYADFVDCVEILSVEKMGEDVVFVQIHEGSTERIETEFEVYEPNDSVGWVTRKEAGDIHIRYWFEPVDGGTRVTHAGIAPLHTNSTAAFESDREELQKRYENNVTEISNLRSILE